MTTKAVFFDAAGTLFKPVRRVGESYAAIAAKHGVTVSAGQINERFRVCFDDAPRLAFPGADGDDIVQLERDWWKRLVAEVFKPWASFADFDDYFNELFAYFAEPTAWTLYPETLETLAALKDRGLILDVISNFDSRLLRILDGLGAADLFEHIIISSRVGYAKPDRQIFDFALRRHGLSPQNALHVGDSETNDLHGANNAGLRGVLVDRSQPANPTNRQCVVDLRGILTLLDEDLQRKSLT
jgi:putative hydrolase of the HAD superfamily